MSENSARGQFVWYDLMTTDLEAAKAFYTDLVGWGTHLWGSSGMSYTMGTVDEMPIGGVVTLPDEAMAGGARPHWIGYVAVPDADATVARAQELGGKVVKPVTPIPTVGRFAVIADPQGALIAPFTPQGAGPQPEMPPPVGHFTWHELSTTTDPDTALAFYFDLFGWEKTSAMDMGEGMGVYQMFGPGGVPFGGAYKKPAEQPGPPAWLHYARVPDVNAAVETVRQKGGQVLNGPMEVPGGSWIAMLLDPQGGPFAVHEIKSEQA